MAGVKITELPVSPFLVGTDYVVTSDEVNVYKSTINSLLTYYQAPVVSLSADTYMLSLSDNSAYIRLASVSNYPTIVILPNSIISWPIGYTTTIKDIVGVGFSLSASVGVTLNTQTSAGAAYQGIQLINVANNVWDVL